MFTNQNEQSFFLSHIKSCHKVLEYGSGQSTIEIAKLCNQIISVEHQKSWYDQVQKNIPNNCVSFLCLPNKEYKEGGHCGTLEEFFDYINAPLPYAPFDIIIIDGRARIHCAALASKLSTNDTLIFIHDWGREEYYTALNYLDLIDICDTMAKFKIKL